jgi:putative transposase
LKKPQKSFAVEYKGARRKPPPQSNSIWGNVELRRFAESDGEVEAAQAGGLRVDSGAAAHEELRVPTTADLQQKTTPILALEEQMADETRMSELVPGEPEAALPKAPEVKKRGPRAKKAAPEGVTSEALVDTPVVKKTRAKRGSKSATAEVKPSARRGGRKAKAAIEDTVESTARTNSPVTTAGDEMEDLLHLEQENQRLRKLLAEKLREENAGLRKRLGLD